MSDFAEECSSFGGGMSLVSVVDASGALLAGAKRLAFQFVERLAVPAFVLDEQGCVLIWNDACARLTGMPANRVIGTRNHWRAFYDEERPCLVDLVVQNRQRHIDSLYDVRHKRSEGGALFAENWCAMPLRSEQRYLAIDASPILDDHGTLIAAIETLRDITEHKRVEAEIEHLATHDAVTGLGNRVFFTRKLDMLDETKAPYAILLFDIDRFKEINDTLGHGAGDAILAQCGMIARMTCPEACAARIGGDEFAIIFEGADPRSQAERAAEQLLIHAGAGVEFDGTVLLVSFSIGIAAVPVDASCATIATQHADQALYLAKSHGGATVRLFEPSLAAQSSLRRATMIDLRKAIERDEFVLHYQPVVQPDGDVEGFEALLRWRHPDRGLVSPAEFIPLAEQSGLIASMGEWVLREACREAARWPKPLRVAVNLSPVQFRLGDIAQTAHAILMETGLPASRLVFELTESAVMDNPSRTLAVLLRLKTLGVSLALDDFGTGYSSLAYLQAFPFDSIKLDRSFVARFGENRRSDAITRAVIGLAHTLSLRIVAEGVETMRQRDLLHAEGCDFIQGYLFGRPAPIETYRALTMVESVAIREPWISLAS